MVLGAGAMVGMVPGMVAIVPAPMVAMVCGATVPVPSQCPYPCHPVCL